MTDQQIPTRPRPLWRRRWFLVSAGVVVVIGVALGVGIWWYLRDDAPAEVSLDAAVEAAGGGTDGDSVGDDGSGGATGDGARGDGAGTDDGDATTDGSSAEAGDGTASGDDGEPGSEDDGDPTTGDNPADGTWFVDTSIGEFSFEDATGSFAGFRVEEELSVIGSTTAVGRSPEVSGTIDIDGTTLVGAEVVVDMTEIVTNDSRRDSAVQRTLDTGEFPTATFVLSEPVELGSGAPVGDPVAVEAPGTLTIHGVSREVAIPIEAVLVEGPDVALGERIALVGSIPIVFADYDVETPTAAIVLSLEDDGIMEFQLLLTRS